jgi:hypothetical protein
MFGLDSLGNESFSYKGHTVRPVLEKITRHIEEEDRGTDLETMDYQ